MVGNSPQFISRVTGLSATTSDTRDVIKTYVLPAVLIAFLAALLALSDEFDDLLYQFLVPYHKLNHASVWLTYSVGMLIALLPLLLFNAFRQIHTRIALCLYSLYVLLFLAGAVYLFDVWLPPFKILLTVFITYLLWLALRAKSAQDSIDYMLQNMRNELSRLGMEPEEDIHTSVDVSQQSRIAKLMLTMQHLRDLHKSRNDALMFISHDIRTPLGAAILLLDKFEQTKYTERMQHLLERANLMAESFVHASRAESADVNKFKIIDMVSLTQQVIDDLYELIHAKKLHVKTSFPEHNVLVRGDFGLLFRTVSNVLLNAVNYSPDNGAVEIGLSADSYSLALKIVDQGPGIPEEKIPKLFKRFSRAEHEYQSANGCGLGLYFVNVTVKKHRGSVAVRNLDKQGAEFLICLPLERRKVNLEVPYERRSEANAAFGDTV